MTTPTVAVTIVSSFLNGDPLAGGSVTIQLTAEDVMPGPSGATIVVPPKTYALDTTGQAIVQLFPNAVQTGLGTRGTQYKATFVDSTGAQAGVVYATIPNAACNLHDNLVSGVPTSLTDGQVAVNLARSYRDQAQAVLSDTGFIAVHGDLPNIDAVAADKANIDSVAANLAPINTNASNMAAIQSALANANTATTQAGIATTQAGTATSQASLSAGYAASAASVAQQDLSGITAAAMHRGPAAVVAMCIDDPRTHSDGGAWTQKTDHLSWANEGLNGKWLGQQASEAAARAVSGATTGDYFQLTTDGKFYKLNITSGTTEVFRGNVAKYGRTAWVAEASRVVGYAIDQPGRPMWMVFKTGINSSSVNMLSISDVSLQCVTALGGKLVVGSGNYGVFVIDFLLDKRLLLLNGGTYTYQGTIAQRNGALGNQQVNSVGLPHSAVNAVAMCTMPDAPEDPVTRLQVPTIAVATGGGVSVIKHDGSVVNSSQTIFFTNVAITPQLLSAFANGSFSYFALAPATLGAAYTLLTPNIPFSNSTGAQAQVERTVLARRSGSRFTRVKLNEMNLASGSLLNDIDATYNTGWMVGDIRRAYLADTAVGVVSGAELVANGAFPSDLSSWALTQTGGYTITWQSAGAVRFDTNSNSGASGALDQAIATVVGKTYRIELNIASTSGQNYALSLVAGTASGGSDVSTSLSNVGTTARVKTAVFTAKSTTTYLHLTGYAAGSATDAWAVVSSVSVKEAVADRTYKAQSLTAFGTLTRAQVGVGSQLTAISGFSAANYLQEAYSADLDFGTGQWRVAAWVNYTTAAASTIAERSYSSGAYITLGTDASGHLTATAYDGTTTRTVTSAAAYNTGTWLKVCAEYSTSGTLALRVNGVTVATATGTPLLTMNNANAVLTVGQNYALTAPFPGSIALLRIGATVATDDQSAFAFAQEREMFRDGAQVCLPDAGAVVDLDYDPVQDKWKVVSATNESSFVGLVQTAQAPVAAGSFTHVVHKAGIKLLSRSTTNPGVDITIPALNAIEQMNKRAEDARAQARLNEAFDWTGQFTASTTNGSTAITSIASLVLPTGATLKGATVSGAGIPAGTTVVDVSGTTAYLSAPATATASGVAISIVDFVLPTGYEVRDVFAAGALKREGASFDYTRKFDGFRERGTFAAAPGSVNVRINARRMAS